MNSKLKDIIDQLVNGFIVKIKQDDARVLTTYPFPICFDLNLLCKKERFGFFGHLTILSSFKDDSYDIVSAIDFDKDYIKNISLKEVNLGLQYANSQLMCYMNNPDEYQVYQYDEDKEYVARPTS